MELCDWAALNYASLLSPSVCPAFSFIFYYLFTEPRRKRPSFQIRAACDRDCSQIAPWARAVQFLSSEPRRTGRSTCCLTRICKAKPLHPHLPLPALLLPPARACLRCGGDYVKLMRRPPFLGSVFAPPLLFLSASGAFRASDSLLCSPIASCCCFALHLG